MTSACGAGSSEHADAAHSDTSEPAADAFSNDVGDNADANRNGIDDAGPSLPPPPATLSEAGLFVSGAQGPLVDGALSYEVRFPLWTDGVAKRRHLILPAGGQIDTSNPDGWAFPPGTRIFKEFIVEDLHVETRLLWKSGPALGDWVSVAYRYREDGSDADALPEGEANALQTPHDVPSVEACFNCHRGAEDFVIGIGAMQLTRQTFDRWVASGVLPADAPWGEPPGDSTQQAALGYLHGNCGHCHGGRHPIATLRDLRLRIPLGIDDPHEAPAWQTSANYLAGHEIGGTRIIVVPGDPASSQLYLRMGYRDELGMPPVGTEVVDAQARALIGDWIRDS